MRRKDDGATVGDFVQLLDEHGAQAAQAVNDEPIVHDLVPDIDRGAIAFDRQLDDLDRAIDARAKAARGRNQQVERGLCEAHGRPCKRLLAAGQGASYEHGPKSHASIKGNPIVKLRLTALALVLLATACSREGEITQGGIYITRSACPQVAIPAATGDITLFNPSNRTDAGALDVNAVITNLRSTCDETGANVVSTATFDVVGTRRDAGPARTVVLPYFDVAMQAGTQVVAKRIGNVALNFADGSQRAQTSGQATIQVSRSVATLPEDVRKELTRERKPGDADASVDPLSDPKVRDAVARATFEHLIGFQLTPEQLRYNATR
jgi:hypothetical protein